MADRNNCTEKCPQAERAHETALGRMYATQELVELVKKIDAGELVEVVRCKDCQYKEAWQRINEMGVAVYICDASGMILVDDLAFCSFGERKET